MPLPLTALAALGLSIGGSVAHAGDTQCKQCCNDAGLYSCPTWLRVFGPGSQAVKDIGGIRVTGLWRLDCETGARFDDAGTVVVAERPADGDILLIGSPTVTVECFREWCILPKGACVQPRPGGGMALLRCTDGQPLTAAQLVVDGPDPGVSYTAPVPTPNPGSVPTRQSTSSVQQAVPDAPSPGVTTETRLTTVVVSGGQTTTTTTSRPTPATPVPNATSTRTSSSSTSTTSAANPGAVGVSTVIIEQGGPEYPPHLPAEGPLAVDFDFDMPPGPGQRCVTNDLVAKEAGRRLDLGDEARLREDHQLAAEEYRAAVTLDRCNAIAWTALGQLALAADAQTMALSALEIATRLRPDHYGALTSLGLAYEARGRRSDAQQAFTQALVLRPGHPAAEDGLGRVRTPR